MPRSLTRPSAAARADEGLWTLDNPPLALLQERYGFTPPAGWLEHVRLGCVRLNDGGSGSFVSPEGLVITNHHVAIGQLQKMSTPEHDYVRNGFYARTRAEEVPCPDLEVNQLVSMEDVTARVHGAVNPAASQPEQSAAQGRDRPDRKGAREEDQPALGRGGALPGWRVLALPLPEVHGRAPGHGARGAGG